MFYCCWNTSYCDYPCQQAHWPHHMEACTQAPATTAVVAKPTAVTVKPVVATAARNVYVQLPPPQQQQQQRGAAGRVAVSTSAAVLQSKVRRQGAWAGRGRHVRGSAGGATCDSPGGATRRSRCSLVANKTYSVRRNVTPIRLIAVLFLSSFKG